MRVILLVTLLACAANARPDVSLGYKYEPDASGAEGLAGLGLPSDGSGGFDSSLGPAGSGGPGAGGPGGSAGGPGNFGPASSFTKKHFYTYAAPEEQDDGAVKHFVLGKPQKDYQVVFVKTPLAKQPRLSVDFAPRDEKTVIYVLAQKEPELNPGDIATPAPTSPSKPEVFFVKYKTPQEAALAQQQIQAQYDALGGTSQYSDEGTAPLNSVVGALDNFGPSYLPPRVRRH